MTSAPGDGRRNEQARGVRARWRLRLTAVVVVGILGHLPSPVGAEPTQLGTAKLRKAAVKCQKIIAQVSAKLVADKLKSLDACANAALTCVQTKQDQSAVCLGKAGQICAKKLSAATAAVVKGQAKIVAAKSCARDLRLPDLLAPDGLGLGTVAGSCETEFGLNICAGLAPLAQCLTQAPDRAAGSLYGQARPRAGELLALLSDAGLPSVDGLPTFAGCDACSVAPNNRPPVERCGKALTKALQTLVVSLESRFGACAQSVFSCVQAQPENPDCLTKSTAGCDKGATTVAAAFTKFAAAIAKQCGTAAVDFEQLLMSAGLNLDAIAAPCAAVGVTGPMTLDALTTCLEQRATCTVGELVQQSVGRTAEFGAAGALGALSEHLTGTCPVETVSSLSARTTGGARFNFGSIVKFLKAVRRPGGIVGVHINGNPPQSTPNFGRGVTRVGGPVRVTFGAITKVPFTYRLGGSPTRAATTGLVAEPPKLVVGVLGADQTSQDYFEIALDPAAPEGIDVTDELELTYADNPPACAFTLVFATRAAGDVSDYTPALRVLDTEAEPTPTSTANLASPTTTPLPTSPTSTTTPSIAPSVTATATPTPTPTATVTPAPDLSPTALGPSSAVAGQSTSASWTITNQGSGPATGIWTDRLLFSTDALLDGGDTLLTLPVRPAALTAGASYTRTLSVTMPCVGAGSYFLILGADSALQIPETDESNNVRVAPITIASVDLAPTALGPSSAVAGQSTTVNWTIFNQGSGGAVSSWADRLYFSTDDTLDAGDTLLTTVARPTGLVAGASYTQTPTVTMPSVTPGSYFLILVSDHLTQVCESDESNNVRVAPITIAAVDLTPAALGPSSAVAGQSTSMTWTISNQGTGGAASTWSDRVYLSTDTTLDVGDTVVTTLARANALAAGAFYNQAPTVTMPSVAAGNYFLILVTDHLGQVFESDESNNVLVAPITIAAVDLTPTALGPSSAVAGQSTSMTWTISNQGTGGAVITWSDRLYLSTDATLDAGDTVLTTLARPNALAAGAFYSQAPNVIMPCVAAGSYFLILVTDHLGQVFEADESNNVLVSPITIAAVDLTPTALGPSSAVAGQNTSVTWTISNQGTGGAANNWFDRVYLSTDATLDVGDTVLTTPVRPNGLAAGAFYARSVSVTMPNVAPGAYFLIVVTDQSGLVCEANENNNQRTAPINLGP